MASKTLKPPAIINPKARDARNLMKGVCQYIEALSTQGKTFLIVGTKPRTSKLVDKLAKRYKDKIFYCKNGRKVYRYKTNQLHGYINRRYSGKILTKLSNLLERREEPGNLDQSVLKEIADLQRQLNPLRGLKKMIRLPDTVIFLLDPRSEYKVLIDECHRLGIKVIYFNKSQQPIVIPPPTPPNGDQTKKQIIEIINDEIQKKPKLNQINKLRLQANGEAWNQLIQWLLSQAKRAFTQAIDPLADLWFDVDFEKARNEVSELHKKYPNYTRDKIANILIKETVFKVAGISYIEDLAPWDSQDEIKNAISCVANCNLKTITQECAEMVFKIAGIYGFDLKDPMRQFEALAAFGIAWLGKRAINAGIGRLEVGFFNEINIRAVSHALMIFTVGNAARVFYKAKLEGDPLLDNPTKFEQVLEKSRCSDLYNVQDDKDLAQVIRNEFPTDPNKSETEKDGNRGSEKTSERIPPPPPPGVDYSHLENSLTDRKWKEADHETRRIMLEIANRAKWGWFDDKSIHDFPPQHLRYINHLWKANSNDRFGFSQQKRIYKGLGGTAQYNAEVWLKFAETVGWKQEENWLYYGELQFDIDAPEGHLPALLGHQKVRWGLGDIQGRRLRLLLSRQDW
jgi:ribosomal protein S2